MSEARAFWLAEPGRGEIRSTTLGSLAPGEIRIRTRVSAISRGTESLVFRGRVPVSQYDAMRCPFQEGKFPGPVKYGYASVGSIGAGPPDLLGRRVFCLHPHQDLYDVPATAVALVPEDLPDSRAALAANMETAVNGLWDAAPRLGDRIAVVGAGVVGCLVASLAARLPGAVVELIDVDPGRSALAAALGCRFATPDHAAGDADLVIHASGSAAGLATALGLAGFEATVLEMSWYGDAAIAAPLGEAFHSRRLTLRSSQVGAVATGQRGRWSHARRMALALALLSDPVYDRLLSGTSPFAELPATMARLAAAPAGTLCHIVAYD
ncbi:MAG: dehydrogenase [Rhodospirillales bacterium]|nr:dehydrogenase [Rhodospirillales bacterium]